MAWIANRGGLSSPPMLEAAQGHVNEPAPYAASLKRGAHGAVVA